ncbi:hypothetical protein OOU_Y34scaffold00464g34 [Pyricularia oryzae Y34]|uniref:Uncharacterized protein n=2 Tax=Pyricularia oryzae TaxID=318829 RepID=A0AA97PME0_PYRO3|nr:hypothetical protein OOU_Y34scaffold00464g34 [Pyricularia oryzae Y34]
MRSGITAKPQKRPKRRQGAAVLCVKDRSRLAEG